MADLQRKVKPALKRQLIAEAGGKCANPGCPNWQSHIHHIKHWAVYKCHNAADMIAICPSCHGSAHHGPLKISDEILYLWKGVERPPLPATAHIYVEPARELKLLTGTIALSTTNQEAIVFDLSSRNRLKFRFLDGDLLQVSSRLQDKNGKEVLRVVENHVRVVRDKGIHFEFRPGRARISLPISDNYIPKWTVDQMRATYPDFGADNRLVAIDLEVIKPGLLRVQGFWPSDSSAVVITKDALAFCQPGLRIPISLVGEGEGSVLVFTGPVTSSLFKLP